MLLQSPQRDIPYQDTHNRVGYAVLRLTHPTRNNARIEQWILKQGRCYSSLSQSKGRRLLLFLYGRSRTAPTNID